MSIIWRKKMSVGNSIIDDQHRYLLCLMNTIELALRDAANKEILKSAIEQLFEYTAYHFDFEERVQAKMKFPRLMDHKIEHQRILADLKVIKAQLDNLLHSDNFDNAVEEAANKEITDSEINALLEEDLGSEKRVLDLNQLTALVRHWVIDHVLGDDMKMKPFLSKLPSNFS